MADLKMLAESRRPAYNFDPAKLKIKTDLNARDFTLPENVEHVRQIADNMKEVGFDPAKPIAIFKDGEDVFISDGECRLRAALLAISEGASIATIPCIPDPGNYTEADRKINQVRANSAKRFTPLEEAHAFSDAHTLGKSVTDIAKGAGRSETHVRNWLRLHALPDDIKALVREGKTSPTVAIENDPDVVRAACAAATADKKVTPKALPAEGEEGEAKEPSARKATALQLVKRLAKHKDPRDSDEDFDDEIRAFAEFINEAKEIVS